MLNEDGTLVLTAGTPDIGGLRASLAMMASEELGVPLDKIRVQIGDTNSLGYNFLTGGSRSTYSSGMATVDAARDIKKEMHAPRRQTLGPARRSGRMGIANPAAFDPPAPTPANTSR